MDIFQRTIHSGVKKTDEGHYLVSSSLLDLEHSFHLELLIHGETREILEATGGMSKAPLSKCEGGLSSVESLVGLKIERGILRQIQARAGGARGCAHMVELMTDAIRLISMMMLGDESKYWGDNGGMTEEEVIERAKPMLRNSCIVFADDKP
jgi:hypothetical protein